MDLVVLSLSNMMAALGITVIVPVISTIPDMYGIDQASAMWVMTAFMITYASFMPIFGKLADLFGLKKVFIVANAIFVLGLLIDSIAVNFPLLVIGRIVQGLGSGGILPVANAYAVEVSESGRERRLALVNATYGIGMILGVNLGGILYQRLGWGSLFLVPLVVSALLTFLCVLYLRDIGPRAESVKLDVAGSTLFALVMGFFILGMKYLTDSTVLGSVYLTLSAASFTAFVLTELRRDEPALDLRTLSKGRNLIYNLSAVLFGFSMFVTVTFIAPFVQLLLGYDVETSVYAIDPFALSMALSIMLGGVLSRRLGLEKTIFLGAISLCVFSFTFSTYVNGTAGFYVLSVLLGLSLGLSMSPITQIVIERAESGKRGMASGMVSIMRSVGGVIGPTVAGFIISKTDFSSLFALENLLDSYRKVFAISGYSALLFSVLALVGIFTKKTVKEGYYAEET